MYLIAGLGNPGREYVNTRHNIGFDAVDTLAAAFNIDIRKINHEALIGEGFIGTKKVLLAKPQTYMNESGRSIRRIADFYKLSEDEIFVIYDDVALPTGRIRIRKNGSAGGHNGMKSIIYHLGTDNFLRVRLGVGAPKGDMVNHVLGKFSKEETATMIETVKCLPDMFTKIVSGRIDDAMNIYNRYGVEK